MDDTIAPVTPLVQPHLQAAREQSAAILGLVAYALDQVAADLAAAGVEPVNTARFAEVLRAHAEGDR